MPSVDIGRPPGDAFPEQDPGSELPSYAQHLQSESASPIPSYAQYHESSPTSPIISGPSVSRGRTQHSFSLRDKKASAWATLNIPSSARSTTSLPTFFQGENVAGSVSLNLANAETVRYVKISITGVMIRDGDSGDRSCYFLAIKDTLWNQSLGDPKSLGKPIDKLRGEYTFPFSITLPDTVSLTSVKGSKPKSYNLPGTFIERHSRASVKYDLTISISRGKYRTDDHIMTNIVFVALEKPGPASLLRQVAYQENAPLPSPDADPEGWKTLKPVSIRGKIFNTREVDVKCTLSLAKPLQYTKGTAIPLHISIETPDSQALDLLSAPRAIVVELQRVLYSGTHAGDGPTIIAWKDVVEVHQKAVWWAAQEDVIHDTNQNSLNSRQLFGEIRLHTSLKASTAIASFRLAYQVAILPFDSVGFKGNDAGSLLIEPVDVVGAYGPGPRPKMYSPPDYDTSPQEQPNRASNLYGVIGGSGAFL